MKALDVDDFRSCEYSKGNFKIEAVVVQWLAHLMLVTSQDESILRVLSTWELWWCSG